MSGALALNSNVLVLNRFFLAVHIVTAREAFRLLFRQCAEVVSLEEDRYQTYDFQDWAELSQLKKEYEMTHPHDDWVRTVSFDIQVPRIIRLLFYDRLPDRGVKLNRRNIFARDGCRCQYCGKKFSSSELSIDHVIPRSQGGEASWDNLVCCCTRCNVRKGGRTPAQAHMTLTRRPFKPKRNPVVHLRLRSEKYRSWRQFLDNAYWSVELI
jgi:5-methylcytosine-specific restriction endonuclease McrA